jgi:hypothetical protein
MASLNLPCCWHILHPVLITAMFDRHRINFHVTINVNYTFHFKIRVKFYGSNTLLISGYSSEMEGLG